MIDDSKSDNTDELLTGIDPLIFQSEVILNEKDYKKNVWRNEINNDEKSSQVGIIVDDIFSARSNDTTTSFNKIVKHQYEPTMVLSHTNIETHNLVHNEESADTDRTNSSHLYEASISASAQTTPRNYSYNKYSVTGFHHPESNAYSNHLSAFYETSSRPTKREFDSSHREFSSAQSLADSKTELQRMQLTNKQLSTQLQEAKLSIQTLSIQLEQVQQECKHKENTVENLDNTLGRLVAGWKKRDSQKDQEIDHLTHQLEAKDQVISESQRISDESKIALSNSMKTLGMEKVKFEQLQKNLGQEIDSLKNEKSQLLADNKELAKRIVHLESELRKHKDMLVLRNNNIESIKQQWCDDRSQLEKDVDRLKFEMGKTRDEINHQQLEIQIRDEKLDQMRNELKIIEEELHRNRKELSDKDISINEMKTKMRALSEENTASLRKLEKDLHMKFQHELNSSLTSINEQQKKSLQTHNNNFQTKLNEQTKRHRLDLERLRQVAEQEITSRLSDNQETISMLRARLERSEKSVKFWQQEKESVEKARNQISARLYEIMKLGYRGSDQISDPIKHSLSAFDQPPQISTPKVVNPTNYLLNLANSHNFTSSIQNNIFEPIRLDSKASIATAYNFTKSNSLSVMSEAPSNFHQNLALTSSINTALSF